LNYNSYQPMYASETGIAENGYRPVYESDTGIPNFSSQNNKDEPKKRVNGDAKHTKSSFCTLL
jgi:hypothetical protein